MVIVIVPLSWAKAGRNETKAIIMTAIRLVITTLMPSSFGKLLFAVTGQLPANKSTKIKYYTLF